MLLDAQNIQLFHHEECITKTIKTILFRQDKRKSNLSKNIFILVSSYSHTAHESGLGLPIRHIKKLQNKLAASTPNGNDLSLSVKSVNQTEKQSG